MQQYQESPARVASFERHSAKLRDGVTATHAPYTLERSINHHRIEENRRSGEPASLRRRRAFY